MPRYLPPAACHSARKLITHKVGLESGVVRGEGAHTGV